MPDPPLTWPPIVAFILVTLVGGGAVGYAIGQSDGGGGTATTAVPQAASGATGATGAAGASAATQQNNAVVEHAQNSKGEQAQAGQTAIRDTLTKKLGMQPNGDFNLPGPFSCYVKTGVEAQNFAYKKNNILYGPNGTDLVFVQTDTTTPLSKCLIAVQKALGW